MELRHLRYFVAVAEDENVTRAAARLHVSQPPLSRQLRDLENELGLQLFDRGPKSLRLTAAGRIFLVEARAVLDRANEAVRVASMLADGEPDEIHVGYAPSLTVKILPRALRCFSASGTRARVRLHDLTTEEMLGGLRDGTLNVALMIRPHRASLRGLNFEPLRKDPVCLAVHAEHPLATVRKIDLARVAREPLAVYAKGGYPEYHAWLERLFRRRKLTPLINEEHDSATSLIAAVESGRGVALVQQGFECLSGPRLRIRPLRPAPSPFVTGVAWRKDSAHGPTADFLAATREAAEQKT